MPRTILVVDDNAISRKIMINSLRKEYDIIEAENGKEALDLMRRHYKMLSAVLLDIVMPEMDGYDVLRHIKENPVLAQLPVIVVTGSEDESERVKALSLGANDFVLKPFNPEIVSHCLRNNIALRETASILNAIQKDKLTGAFTREAFFEKAGALIKSHDPGHYILSCFDVDNFKLINDQYGAVEGDRILREIGKAVRAGIEDVGGVTGRISADNFVVLFPAAREKAVSLERMINRKLIFPERQSLVFSVGRYLIMDLSLPVSAIYDRAYIAKQSVKGRYDKHLAYFDEAMLEKLVRDQAIVGDMERALAEKQFESWFQPQYNHVTGALVGAEALVRWRNPQKGIVPPGDFIPLFEQNGFIYELDKYIWREAARYLRKWLNDGLMPLPVSVNVSRYDIFKSDLVSVLVGLVSEFDLPIDLMRLEITESAFSKSTQQIVDIVKELIELGFTVEIDDFGSGYSSLNVLKNVPAQIVKLDMRFLEDSDDGQRGGNILESVVRMSKWLGMSVIAEGVETIEQGDFLKSIGCSHVQGYLYARPMPAGEYEMLLRDARGVEKEKTLETVENFNTGMFWNPASMDSLIFNSYVGSACVFEYCKGRLEVLRATDKYAKLLGEKMTVDALLDLDLMKYFDRDFCAETFLKLDAARDEKEEIAGEFLLRNLPGCPRETYLRATMRVIASAGERSLVYCISENITAQRVLERRERRTARQLQIVMDHINCGITATTRDKNGVRYLLANDKYYALLGYTRAQYAREIGNDKLFSVHPEDMPRVMEVIDRVRATGAPASMEYRVVRRDQTVVWLRSFLSMTTFEDVPAPVQLRTYADITEARETESREEFLINNIPGGVAIYEGHWETMDGIRLTYFSDGFCRLFGYTRAEYTALAGDNPLSLVDQEYIPGFMMQITALVKTGTPIDYVYRARVKDGSDCWIHIKAVAGEKDGDQMAVNAVLFDVTEHQEALDRLRVSEEENRLALKHSNNVVCRYDVISKQLRVSESANPIFGMPSIIPDVPLSPVREGLISAETADAYVEFYDSIAKGEKNGSVIYQRQSTLGWRWIEAHSSTIFASDGAPVAAVISFTDVTESYEKDAAYRKWMQSLRNKPPESYSLYRCNISRKAILDTAEGSLLYIQFKPGVFNFDSHTEQYVAQCVYPEDREAFSAFLNVDTLLEKYYRGQRVVTQEYRETLPAGGYRWLRLTVDLVEYPHSADVEAYLLFENIDDVKRTALLTLERAETDPLTGVLNRTTFSERVEESIARYGQNAKHALLMLDIDGFKMVNDEFGHGAGDQALIDIANLLRTILRRDDLVARLGGDEFVVFLSNIPEERIAANKAKQICELTHKTFSPEVAISGSVGIAVYPGDGRNFETLYKRADETLYHVKGTGRDNFAFYQEDMKDEMQKMPAPNAAAKRICEKKRRMLIVDDNTLDYEVLANIFKEEFVIEKAKDGATALIRLRHYGSAISVMLLDLMMPGMDGFAVLEKMAQSPEMSLIPVIVVSGDSTRDASLRAIRLGATDFVMKPVDPDILRIRVQSAISKAENEKLRAKNSFLEMQEAETAGYKAVLEKIGLAVAEMDWGKGTFMYSPSVAKCLAGRYDGRTLWHILLSDLVTDAQTVNAMQQLVHDVADDRRRTEGAMTAKLKTPSGRKRAFDVRVYKMANEYGLTDKMLMTFQGADGAATNANAPEGDKVL